MESSKDIVQLELRKFVAPEFIFGAGARQSAGNYARQLGAQKVFLTTDKIIMATSWFSDVVNSLTEFGLDYDVFSNISPNPRDFEVMEGADRFGKSKCNIILALGGGSVIDCAKGIGIVATNKKDIRNFEGVDKISSPMPPLICIPTTSGSSADVSQFAIINNYADRYKMAIISKATVPDVALIDPEILTSMNPFLTACTGMDAFTHAIEAYASNAASAFTDLWAEESMRLLVENLRMAVEMPNDIQARGKVMLASLYAGLAFSNASLGCVHAMAHSLGGYLDLPHGECNAILLPHVVDFNFLHSPEKYRKVAELLGIDTVNQTQKQVHKNLVETLVVMRNELGITSSLKEKGVKTDSVTILAQKAINDPCNATNPRPPKMADLSAIYSEAL
jgi:alcohol dehydrogenase class IV